MPKATVRTIALLCSLWLGITLTQHLSGMLLPLSIHNFIQDPKIIGLILAIDPLFGFIAQPIVGILGDRIWTRFGRRAFFLILASPVVACCLAVVPLAGSLWQLVALVVVYQFCQDILFGSDQPLLADLVPPSQRPLVVSILGMTGSVGFLFVLLVGMPLVESFKQANGQEMYGAPLYWIAAACQIIFVMGAAFFLKERKVVPKKRPPLTFKRYFSDIAANSDLLRLVILNFSRSFLLTGIVSFVSLYAIKTLLFTEGSFGKAWSIGPFLGLFISLPIGWIATRFNKVRIIQSGFVLVIVSCLIGLRAGDPFWGEIGWPSFLAGAPLGLVATAVTLGVSFNLVDITYKSYVTEFYDSDIVGQLQSAVNIFWAIGRTIASMVVPLFIFVQDDYRPIWVIGIVFALISLIVTLGIKGSNRSENSSRAAGAE